MTIKIRLRVFDRIRIYFRQVLKIPFKVYGRRPNVLDNKILNLYIANLFIKM